MLVNKNYDFDFIYVYIRNENMLFSFLRCGKSYQIFVHLMIVFDAILGERI